ncbi:histone deacetylase HDT2 [Cocos nucifera]|nr:histone deacetylase HDT2 [Cocos nucifera]
MIVDGVEVKPGEIVKCDPGEDKYLHLSQASLGEVKKDKGNENVPIFVKFNDQKLVLGTLSAEKYSDFDSDEDMQLGQKVNGKTEVKDEQAKPSTGKVSVRADASAAKPKDMAGAEDDSDDEDEDASSDGEDEATPQKTESGKKRPAGSASKMPAPEKKAKLVSPVGSQKTGGDGKTGGHTATPHPAKYAGKTPASGDKSKQQTPKSAGSVSCKSCSKTFNSDNALQAHTKAKHGAAK